MEKNTQLFEHVPFKASKNTSILIWCDGMSCIFRDCSVLTLSVKVHVRFQLLWRFEERPSANYEAAGSRSEDPTLPLDILHMKLTESGISVCSQKLLVRKNTKGKDACFKDWQCRAGGASQLRADNSPRDSAVSVCRRIPKISSSWCKFTLPVWKAPRGARRERRCHCGWIDYPITP